MSICDMALCQITTCRDRSQWTGCVFTVRGQCLASFRLAIAQQLASLRTTLAQHLTRLPATTPIPN